MKIGNISVFFSFLKFRVKCGSLFENKSRDIRIDFLNVKILF